VNGFEQDPANADYRCARLKKITDCFEESNQPKLLHSKNLTLEVIDL
jgi:hypothetical protein